MSGVRRPDGNRFPVTREEAIINIFEQNTYSVVNIFDVTLTVSAYASVSALPAICYNTPPICLQAGCTQSAV
jgi:hypothetical protein